MLAGIDISATIGVGTFILSGLIGVVAWSFRNWSRGVENKVDELGDKVDRVEGKADDARVRIAYLAGSLGKPQNWPTDPPTVPGVTTGG